ncbi:hypothetical protein [Aureimonas glaciei]|uniref:Uncharacterized protein n=1 Tax=Aureimonas glaciei TaxID=1776957 RepID=A0A916Y4U6_9HYPH|nr:hypothetical protein [Aureimonas glaciei]GGD30665.1 hypothetical protein GCM10011335_37160 [Aureimonas glaciei]
MTETATRKFSENAALIILDFMTSPWGFRLDRSWVENALPDWITAANISDQAVALKAGGTEARWRLGMSYNMAERPVDVLQRMLDACDGAIFATPNQGLALKVGQWEEPTVTLDEDAVVAFSGLTRGGDVLTRATTVRARYTSRPHKYVEQDADPWVDDEAASVAGEDGPDLSLFACPSHSQARRLQKIAYHRLNPNWRGTLVCNLRGLAAMGHRFIRVSLADYGIDETFEIQGQPAFVMAEGSVVKGIQIEVASMSAAAYAWNPATEEGTAPLVPEEIEPEERDIPVPTGFTVSRVNRVVSGVSLAFIRMTANAPDFGGDTIVFEISTNGGTSYSPVTKERDAVEAEYGPMQDGVTYSIRAVIVSATGRRGTPTSAVNLTSIFGPELVVNGAFSTDTAWDKQAGWTIGSGVASHSGTGSNISQSVTVVPGQTYCLTFTVSSYSSGSLSSYIAGSTVASAPTVSAAGSYTAYLVAPAGTTIVGFGTSGTMSIDNVSLRRISG